MGRGGYGEGSFLEDKRVNGKKTSWLPAQGLELQFWKQTVWAPTVGAGVPSSLVLMISSGVCALGTLHLGPTSPRDASYYWQISVFQKETA